MLPSPAYRRLTRHKGKLRETAKMSPDDDLDADLRELARSKPRSGRAAQAKASALRTIERLGRPQQEVPPMPEGWYPHEPGDAFLPARLGALARASADPAAPLGAGVAGGAGLMASPGPVLPARVGAGDLGGCSASCARPGSLAALRGLGGAELVVESPAEIAAFAACPLLVSWLEWRVVVSRHGERPAVGRGTADPHSTR
jgi:hypothetical protein